MALNVRFTVCVEFWKDTEGNGPGVVQGREAVSQSYHHVMEGPKRNT